MGNGKLAALQRLERQITSCRKCPRLTEYIARISAVKTARFRDWEYWGRPLPGFGDPDARLLIIGLAPAAHGGNRTGRMFTGDSSGDWLFRALYETGFANKPTSVSRDDGMKVSSCYITASVRCAPPANKPTPQELRNCAAYLREELRILRNVKVVLTLGRVAFNAYRTHVREESNSLPADFRHGAVYKADEGRSVVCSYHPSRQNTQTRKLTWSMWLNVFKQARRLLDETGGNGSRK